MTYYFSKILPVAFDEAVQKTVEGLKQAGFGIITEIDVKRTLKERIGVDFRSYRILGACNPKLAYEALQLDDKIGNDLPPVSWTALSWKILIYRPWPDEGIFHEEVEVHGEPDRIHSAAG